MAAWQNKKESGFVALITAIILSLILIIITVTLNQSGFFTRSILVDSENKERSVGLAEACVDVAILRLANDPGYIGGGPAVDVGIEKCYIGPINPLAVPRKITTWAEVPSSGGATTNLCVRVNPPPSLSVISWNEIPTPPCP